MTSISPHYHVKQTGSLSLVPRETVTVLEHSPVLTRQQSSLGRIDWKDPGGIVNCGWPGPPPGSLAQWLWGGLQNAFPTNAQVLLLQGPHSEALC